MKNVDQTCVNCHTDVSENEWYCSDSCKIENESPRKGNDCEPTGYQMTRTEEVTGVSIGEQE